MATNRQTGIIEKAILKKMYEEAHIEWRIPDITTINEMKTTDWHESPPFIIAHASCVLKLYPKWALNNDFMKLFLDGKDEHENSEDEEQENSEDEEQDRPPPEFNISLKKLDGSVEHLVSGIMRKRNESGFHMGDIIRRSELLQRKSELAPHDVLTIICKLKCQVTDFSDKSLSLKLIKLEKLSEDFMDLFGEKETCDIILKVKDKEYKAHRSVLVARSSVFAATFKHDTLERQTGIITIPDCDPETFQAFLKYIYCGKVEKMSSCCALNLYYTSDKYDVQELKTFCIEYLSQHLTVENICEVAIFADERDEATLFSMVQDFFNRNARKIFATSEWDNLLKTNRRLANKLLLEMANVKLKD